MSQCPPSPSFQSLTVGLGESGLEVAWGSLKGGLSPSYYQVPSVLKRGFLHRQTPWEDTSGWGPLSLCFQHRQCFSMFLKWGSEK